MFAHGAQILQRIRDREACKVTEDKFKKDQREKLGFWKTRRHATCPSPKIRKPRQQNRENLNELNNAFLAGSQGPRAMAVDISSRTQAGETSSGLSVQVDFWTMSSSEEEICNQGNRRENGAKVCVPKLQQL